GLEPSSNRLRAGRPAARTSVPSRVTSRPGRSRISAAQLSAGGSPVELQAAVSTSPLELGSMGPEGLEPPPTGLRGRHAAATPRPRAGHLVPGYAFGPGHHLGPR